MIWRLHHVMISLPQPVERIWNSSSRDSVFEEFCIPSKHEIGCYDDYQCPCWLFLQGFNGINLLVLHREEEVDLTWVGQDITSCYPCYQEIPLSQDKGIHTWVWLVTDWKGLLSSIQVKSMHEMRSLSNIENDDVTSSSQFGSWGSEVTREQLQLNCLIATLTRNKSHQFINHGTIIVNEYEKFPKLAGAQLKHFTCRGAWVSTATRLSFHVVLIPLGRPVELWIFESWWAVQTNSSPAPACAAAKTIS